MNNQDSTIRTKTIDINNNEPSCYCYCIEVKNAVVVVIISMIHMQNCEKCVPDAVKNINVRVFNLL